MFPSNFVQVVETSSPTTQAPAIVSSSALTNITNPVANKLSLFGGSKASKTSLSSNSLNSNSSNNNNNNSNNNLNNIMNNTQDNSAVGLASTSYGDDSSIASSERRPKPIRGVGLGDIFAAGKPKPLLESTVTTNLSNSLQKQIPKKPPPPTPTSDNTSGTSTDQAPALPPKPGNQFSPHLHHTKPLPPTVQPLSQQQQHHSTQQVREQARVIYAYDPSNDDELAMQVGDIIDIIDKDIEDAGWWKGELRGKIGVFPDNFVQLLETPILQPVSTAAPTITQDWQQAKTPPNQNMTSNFNQNIEGKFKSVFAATPKGFSRELENNLEKHNSPASFLSLKRNKFLEQQMSGEPNVLASDHFKRDDAVGQLQTNTTKLNHITANRAKGPSRRPPSNILNKRNQLDQGKRESNGRDDPSHGSLPINPTTQSTTHDTLSSLPLGQQTTTNSTLNPTIEPFSSKPNESSSSSIPIKPSLSLDNVIENQTPSAPKAGQRGAPQQSTQFDKSKTPSTPPWMLELRKAHAEKKRDSPSVNPVQDEDVSSTPAEVLADVPNSATNNIVPTLSSDASISERRSAAQPLRGSLNSIANTTPILPPPNSTPTVGSVKNLSSRYSGDFNAHLQSEQAQRGSVLSCLSNHQESNNELSSLSTRLGSATSNKNGVPNKLELGASFGLNSSSAVNSNNENGSNNNNNNVPTSVNKFSPSSSIHQSNLGASSQIAYVDNGMNQTVNSSPVTQRSILTNRNELDKTTIHDIKSSGCEQVLTLNSAQYDNLQKQISKMVISEISELKENLSKLREENAEHIADLKSVLEVMKVELKACQSATENQKRYIKELVNNLADERKKIAEIQIEIDRNLK